MLAEYHPYEMVIFINRELRNALKFGTSGEVNSKKGEAPAEGLMLPPPNCSEVGAPQVELNGTVLPRGSQYPLLQRLRTKLIFVVFFDDPFLD